MDSKGQKIRFSGLRHKHLPDQTLFVTYLFTQLQSLICLDAIKFAET